MEKPELVPLPTWFQRAWLQLRSALFIGTVVAGFVMGALKTWNEVFPPKVPATVTDVQNTNAELVEVVDGRLRAALATYTDSLARERKLIEDSVARPVYQAILDLDRRISRIERRQVEAGMAIEEQRQESAAATAELMNKMNDARNTEELKTLMGQMLSRQEELETEVKQLRTGRNTKQRF